MKNTRLKQAFQQAYANGQNGSDFNDWWEIWDQSPELIEVLREYLGEKIFVNKNVIAPGSTIVTGGNFHLGDK